MTNHRGLAALVLLLGAAPALAQSSQACDGLRSLALATTVVTTAAIVSGSFTPPGATNANATIRNPQVATYKGTGSLDDAANYTCK
ncbi:MAG TPA: hypothetical protein VFB92_27705 [Vicinamibacterales bacterium]|jgi:Na+-translocating ferredoxin:NAD+ oxidoreductase RnfE subunit|nr:hypothetical protein [Vicinamibacterales bacterium]